MAGEGLSVDKMVARRFLDVRYVGQSFELTVDYPARSTRTRGIGADLAKVIGDGFYKAHLRRFGYADRSEPVEIVNQRLKLNQVVNQKVVMMLI